MLDDNGWLQTVEHGHPVFIHSGGYRNPIYTGAKIARVMKAFIETDDARRMKFSRTYGRLRGGSYGDPYLLNGADQKVLAMVALWRKDQARAKARFDAIEAMTRVGKLPLDTEQWVDLAAYLAKLEASLSLAPSAAEVANPSPRLDQTQEPG